MERDALDPSSMCRLLSGEIEVPATEDATWREDEECDDRSVSVTAECGRVCSQDFVSEGAIDCKSVSEEMSGVTDW